MGVMGSVPEDQESHSPSHSPGSKDSPHLPSRLSRPCSSKRSRAYPTGTSDLTTSDDRMVKSWFAELERRQAEGTTMRRTTTASTSQSMAKSKTDLTPPCPPGIVRPFLCFFSSLSPLVPYGVALPPFPLYISHVVPFRPQLPLETSYNIS